MNSACLTSRGGTGSQVPKPSLLLHLAATTNPSTLVLHGYKEPHKFKKHLHDVEIKQLFCYNSYVSDDFYASFIEV